MVVFPMFYSMSWCHNVVADHRPRVTIAGRQ